MKIRAILWMISAALAVVGLLAVVFVATDKAETVKIGFVTTLTTGAGVIGRDMQNAVDLALDHLGHKMAGLDAEVIYADDQFKPQIGKQKTQRLVTRDKVDFVSGYIWSHVLLASRKTVVDSGAFLIISNAGASQVAGKLCHKNIFTTSWQNDQVPMALGKVLNDRGVKSLYIVAPNYAAGKNMVTGVERTFRGKVAGKDMTKWPGQIDFAAEIAKVRAAKPDGVFIFFPGKHTGAFLRQFKQAGLNGKIPLYSVFSVDSISLPKLQKAKMDGVLGSFNTNFWSPDLDTPANRRFVSGFRKKYGRYPSHYAAQSYDSIMLINSALVAVKGKLKDKDGIRRALRKADFQSVRGPYRYNQNHFPIQNFYLRQVVTDKDGNWTNRIVATVFKDHKDPYYKLCRMRW
ncbi:MAG: ABC transporter substrate-binding protein [Alphaproteobacteria bacterium]